MMTRFTVEHDCSRDYFCALILELIYVAYACVCSIISIHRIPKNICMHVVVL